VSVPRKHKAQAPGIVFHRSRSPFQQARVARLRVTTVARTLVDLSSVLTPLDLEFALDSAQRRFARLPQWLERHLAERDRHAPGVATLRELLALRTGGASDSPLEVKVRRVLRRSRLERPTLRHQVFDGDEYVMRLDFAWPPHKVALHVDSYRWHRQRERFERDARQRTRLAALGWTSVTVTHLALEWPDWLDALSRVLHERQPQTHFPFATARREVMDR